MTVKELKDMLANYPDSMPVYLSSDEEGNSFHSVVETDSYYMDVDNRVEIMDDTDFEHLCNESQGVDITSAYDKVVVLWP